MVYTLSIEQTIAAPADAVWATRADMPSYPTWDPRDAELRLDGDFVAGTTGFSRQAGSRGGSSFTLTLVEPGRRWVNRIPLPAGRLEIDHELEPVDGGAGSTVRKIYRVYGPVALQFRLHYSRGIRRELPASFAALTREANRRVAATDADGDRAPSMQAR